MDGAEDQDKKENHNEFPNKVVRMENWKDDVI